MSNSLLFMKMQLGTCAKKHVLNVPSDINLANILISLINFTLYIKKSLISLFFLIRSKKIKKKFFNNYIVFTIDASQINLCIPNAQIPNVNQILYLPL